MHLLLLLFLRLCRSLSFDLEIPSPHQYRPLLSPPSSLPPLDSRLTASSFHLNISSWRSPPRRHASPNKTQKKLHSPRAPLGLFSFTHLCSSIPHRLASFTRDLIPSTQGVYRVRDNTFSQKQEMIGGEYAEIGYVMLTEAEGHVYILGSSRAAWLRCPSTGRLG